MQRLKRFNATRRLQFDDDGDGKQWKKNNNADDRQEENSDKGQEWYFLDQRHRASEAAVTESEILLSQDLSTSPVTPPSRFSHVSDAFRTRVQETLVATVEDRGNLLRSSSFSSNTSILSDFWTTWTTSRNDGGDDSFRIVHETLTSRGFVVKDYRRFDVDDDDDEYVADAVNERGQRITFMAVDGEGSATYGQGSGSTLTSPFVGDGSFGCLSLMDGIIYGVTVALVDDEDFARSLRTLADVGMHPHVVSYFSGWTDAHFRYAQTEYWPPGNLRPCHGTAADYRTVLEHVACALHYLHDGKKYAHNRVDRQSIYSTGGGSGVVYKLGGFNLATKLPVEDGLVAASVTLADVGSLCSTVSLLLRDCNNGGLSTDDDEDDDVDELRSYLSFVAAAADGVTTTALDVGSALAVWRWCRSVRHQRRPQQQRCRRQSLVAAMMTYGSGGELDTVVQAETATAFRRVRSSSLRPHCHHHRRRRRNVIASNGNKAGSSTNSL